MNVSFYAVCIFISRERVLYAMYIIHIVHCYFARFVHMYTCVCVIEPRPLLLVTYIYISHSRLPYHFYSSTQLILDNTC